MHRRIVLFRLVSSLILTAIISAISLSVAQAAEGRFKVSYKTPPANIAPLVDKLKASGFSEKAADFVSGALKLPQDVPTVFETCGVENAFYHPQQKRITFCYELLGTFAAIVGTDKSLTEEEVETVMLGSTLFFLLHEIGHALVDVLNIPITGREEDAVDDLAGLILIEADGYEELLGAAYSFDVLAQHVEASGQNLAFWDEHSLNAQRAYTLTCLVFGSQPDSYTDLVGPNVLPVKRAERCPNEYRQKSSAWERLLATHMKADAHSGVAR